MLKFGNKEFRNLQEQVAANKQKIEDIIQVKQVLDGFGLTIVGEVETAEEMPTVEAYKAEHED